MKKQKMSLLDPKRIALRPIQNIQYKVLRDTIVDASRIIREDQEKEKKKLMGNNHSSKLLLDALEVLFLFTVLSLAILTVFLIVSSIIALLTKATSVERISGFVCWGAYLLALSFCFFVKRFANRRRLYIVLLWIIIFIFVSVFAWILFVNPEQIFAICFVLFFVISASFCHLSMRSLKKETDGSYLVTYFSAITGMVALIVSFVALFVSHGN